MSLKPLLLGANRKKSLRRWGHLGCDVGSNSTPVFRTTDFCKAKSVYFQEKGSVREKSP